MIFPVEIWQIIFQYCDAVTLTRLRRVCHMWNGVIEEVLTNSDAWYRMCKKGIPKYLWSAILEKLRPKLYHNNIEQLRMDSCMWVQMYRSWIKWRQFTKRDASIDRINLSPELQPMEQITCVATLENILGVGSIEGYIRFYDISSSEKKPIFIADQAECVCDLHLFTNECDIIAVSSSIHKKVRFWDVGSKKRLVQMYSGSLISTSCGYCYTVANNSLLAEWRIQRSCYECDVDDFVALLADENKVTLLTEKGYRIKVEANHAIEIGARKFVQPPNTSVRRYYLFKPEIAVCITGIGTLGISAGHKPWKIYNIFSLLHGVPTAILFYLELFIIGIDSGEVHVFHVGDANYLEELDFNSIDSKSLVLGDNAIIALDITYYQNEQYLIAASETAVHITKIC
ncbi:uncharacterized protein LOC105702635 isoform X2 [Orussus abietinus]|uniref:uncharacterized protein LOC105702635 isoform X2 n=1 Tax=Orussus abietinus TaxID=222816 RepID=UPI000C715E16|nr:uncharacterized protein LOC105702635 isoform X2 [Orussus abietinus]